MAGYSRAQRWKKEGWCLSRVGEGSERWKDGSWVGLWQTVVGCMEGMRARRSSGIREVRLWLKAGREIGPKSVVGWEYGRRRRG